MAELERPDWLLAGRWKWTADGFDSYLMRGCSVGDIDGHLETNGRHLFIEGKHWTTEHQHPLPPHAERPDGIPQGQLSALRSLVRHGFTVWLLYGQAHGMNPAMKGDPLYLIELGTAAKASHCAELVDLAPEHRRAYLQMRLGLWQAEAEGRQHVTSKKDGSPWTREVLESWRFSEQVRAVTA